MKNYVKVCTKCGKYNQPNKEICDCGESLLFTIPSEVEEDNDEKKTVNDLVIKKKYRQCKVCGTKNYLENGKDVRKCNNPLCFNDELYRSRIEVETDENNKVIKDTENSVDSMKLIERGTKTELEIPTTGVVLGRLGSVYADFFADYEYVGRAHCEIRYANGFWQVKDMSRNKTRINGKEVSKEAFEDLKNGDLLSLANVHFEVRF